MKPQPRHRATIIVVPTADELVSPAAVSGLVRCLERVVSQRMSALRKVKIVDLGLSDRVRTLRDALLVDVPGTYADLDRVFRAALEDAGFSGWMIWPVTEAVAARAVGSAVRADFEAGLGLLADLTTRLTSEFAIRTFLIADLDRSLAVVRSWTDHDDEAVRRLASEGTRARLPWARRVPALFADPSPTVPILDDLHRDESDYVRRSVANHLNDISRLDPDLAVYTAKRWLADPAPTTARLVRHAMRSLIKQGHPGALELMGFSAVPGLSIHGLALDRQTVPAGGEITFTFAVRHDGAAPVRVAIDYVVHFVKANGSTAGKVFKLTTRELDAGRDLVLTKKHSFRPISTRVYYPGTHRIDVQINGENLGSVSFILG